MLKKILFGPKIALYARNIHQFGLLNALESQGGGYHLLKSRGTLKKIHPPGNFFLLIHSPKNTNIINIQLRKHILLHILSHMYNTRPHPQNCGYMVSI